MPEPSRCLKAALKYLKDLHYSVIPINKETKKPLVKWKEFQTRLATEEEVLDWFTKWPDANIGIVTGAISNLLVLDLDDLEKALPILEPLIPDSLVFPIADTPRGGEHWYFLCPNCLMSIDAGTVIPGCDLRANGGYIIAPPSIGANGIPYKWRENLKPTKVKPDALPQSYIDLFNATKYYPLSSSFSSSSVPPKVLVSDNLLNNSKTSDVNNLSVSMLTTFETEQNVTNKVVLETKAEQKPNKTNKSLSFQKGSRNQDLFSFAFALFRSGIAFETALKTANDLKKANNWNDIPDKEIYATVESAFKRTEIKELNSYQIVKGIVREMDGYFGIKEVINAYQAKVGILPNSDSMRIYLSRLKDEKIIKKFKDKHGTYKLIESRVEFIDWLNAPEGDLDIRYPAELELLVKTFSREIQVVAGMTNSGKTAFLLNVALMNIDKWAGKIKYFSSEAGGQVIKERPFV